MISTVFLTDEMLREIGLITVAASMVDFIAGQLLIIANPSLPTATKE